MSDLITELYLLAETVEETDPEFGERLMSLVERVDLAVLMQTAGVRDEL